MVRTIAAQINSGPRERRRAGYASCRAHPKAGPNSRTPIPTSPNRIGMQTRSTSPVSSPSPLNSPGRPGHARQDHRACRLNPWDAGRRRRRCVPNARPAASNLSATQGPMRIRNGHGGRRPKLSALRWNLVTHRQNYAVGRCDVRGVDGESEVVVGDGHRRPQCPHPQPCSSSVLGSGCGGLGG
jgi:hypothetical protein